VAPAAGVALDGSMNRCEDRKAGFGLCAGGVPSADF
jgi:hypothetical protein